MMSAQLQIRILPITEFWSLFCGREVYSTIANEWFDDQTFYDTVPDNARMPQELS